MSGFGFQPWMEMWIIAGTLFFACKALTLLPFKPANAAQGVAYLFLWPGMNARAFFRGVPRQNHYATELRAAFCKTGLGLGLILIAKAILDVSHPILTGWITMIGLVLALHSGIFHLISIFWRLLGFNAAPIMRAPLDARSLSDFWGGRWNIAFTDFVQSTMLRPLARRFDVCRATLVIFIISGLLHELVITVPARAAYGLPTLYFTLQGSALLLERSQIGRCLGLHEGARGRIYLWLIAGLPAFFLFPPIFIERIIIPMLRAI